ncbi:MAG: amidase family protein [Pigmentiphaga sp.]|nr:amidase family protein [Pigmentiphaga sp.]
MSTSTMNHELWRWSATDLAAAIARGDISCREAVASCLERTAAVNPIINAATEILADEALRAADAADARVRRGEPLPPLHGVPVTTKVNVDQAGLATTNGVRQYWNVIATEDSPAVANLRKAGAIPIARTNTPAFSVRWFTSNALHGRTINPCNAALTAGGSSGGASAAVAAGMGPLAHGNDQGGSVRYPAYACGVYGLRPGLGRVPAFNPSGAEERLPATQLSSVQGILARSVNDIRLGLQALSARDVRDPWWVPGQALRPGPAYRRVALCASLPGHTADPAVSRALQVAAKQLADAGFEVEEATPPRFQEAADLWLSLTAAEARMNMLDAALDHGDAEIRHALPAMLNLAPELDLPGYMRALALRSTLHREWSAFFERHPLLLLPTSWQLPFAAEADQAGGDTMRRLLDAQSPLLATAILGLPGLAAPMPPVDGTPVGIQLVGGRFSEELLLDAADTLAAGQRPLAPIDPLP